MRGHLAICRGRDGTIRAELGSDGEYLIDAFRPYAITPVDPSIVYANEAVSIPDMFEQMDWGHRIAPA